MATLAGEPQAQLPARAHHWNLGWTSLVIVFVVTALFAIWAARLHERVREAAHRPAPAEGQAR